MFSFPRDLLPNIVSESFVCFLWGVREEDKFKSVCQQFKFMHVTIDASYFILVKTSHFCKKQSFNNKKFTYFKLHFRNDSSVVFNEPIYIVNIVWDMSS